MSAVERTDHYVGDFVRLEGGTRDGWNVTVYSANGEPSVIFVGTITEAVERVAMIRLALATFDGFATERHEAP